MGFHCCLKEAYVRKAEAAEGLGARQTLGPSHLGMAMAGACQLSVSTCLRVRRINEQVRAQRLAGCLASVRTSIVRHLRPRQFQHMAEKKHKLDCLRKVHLQREDCVDHELITWSFFKEGASAGKKEVGPQLE